MCGADHVLRICAVPSEAGSKDAHGGTTLVISAERLHVRERRQQVRRELPTRLVGKWRRRADMLHDGHHQISPDDEIGVRAVTHGGCHATPDESRRQGPTGHLPARASAASLGRPARMAGVARHTSPQVR